jgi:hypothetical protein
MPFTKNMQTMCDGSVICPSEKRKFGQMETNVPVPRPLHALHALSGLRHKNCFTDFVRKHRADRAIGIGCLGKCAG